VIEIITYRKGRKLEIEIGDERGVLCAAMWGACTAARQETETAKEKAESRATSTN
jgi:hypothetical protein